MEDCPIKSTLVTLLGEYQWILRKRLPKTPKPQEDRKKKCFIQVLHHCSGAVAERLRNHSREQKVPSSSPR